ncbi:MAG: hypothetical protein IAF38_14800 [Bacteroidia bacterium]|nr:hypothetical protein [Bacteroidia bacterium]
MASVHIGKKIKEVLGQSRFTVTEFAAKINKTRTVVYDIFKRHTMDTGLLMKIGKVLDHDFLGYLLPDTFREEKTLYQKKKDAELFAELEDCKKRIAELEKRNVLLEKYVKLLEEKKPKKSRKKPNA